MTKQYRPGLPKMPRQILNLPVERGYPVPWFVAKINGVYDFRVIAPGKMQDAINKSLCWVCGEKLGKTLAFSIGPMCAINRTISEPPAHRECAEFSIKGCPFLNQQQSHRRETNMPDTVPAAGIGLKRQPGAVCLWITRGYKVERDPFSQGVLFRIGDPVEVLWYREGRAATRAEVMESIETGLPKLMEFAKLQGMGAIHQLQQMKNKAIREYVEKIPE